jgi:sulfate permease, SulP family
VGLSIVLFLRRVRLLVVRELRVDADGRLHEVDVDAPGPARCTAIRILHVEGPMFFGAAGELDGAIARFVDDPEVKVLVLRLKRAQGLDYTTAMVLRQAHEQMAATGRHLVLVGMRADVMKRLEDIGLTHAFGRDELFPTRPGWFEAMNTALRKALETVRAEHPGGHGCADCPMARYLEGAVTEDHGA